MDQHDGDHTPGAQSQAVAVGDAPRVRVVRPDERSTTTAQSSGIRREAAIALETTGTTGLWMGVARTPGGTVSAWHHHGECETGIYVVAGRARFSWGPGGTESAEVGPGDFVAVPAGLVHREEALGIDEFLMVVARNCSGILSVDVDPAPAGTAEAHSIAPTGFGGT